MATERAADTSRPKTREAHTSRRFPNTIDARDILAEDLRDPAFRRLWERHFLANEVSIEILRYRAKHRLTQAALAKKLGVSQPYINNLEDGEHTPTIATLRKLADALGITFVVEVRPRQAPRLLPARPAATRSRAAKPGRRPGARTA